VADLQKTFHVQINKFNMHGETYRANTSDPVIDDPAGAHVLAIGGLHDYRPRLNFVRPSINGQPPVRVAVSASTNGLFFSPQCFREPEFQSFTTNGGLPKAFYFGNRYGADITNTTQGQLPPCGYSPSDIQTAYKLKQLYKQGLDGTGQSVVIVDPCGSPTIQADAELFSQVYGLPDLTPSNFKIVGTAPAGCDPSGGGAGETTLDVEWAHAVAPGATIYLVISPSFFFNDLDAAILTAVTNHFGNVISNSYGAPESLLDSSVFNPTDAILEMAAAQGIAVNYSSGDNGDWFNLLGFTDVQYPASSPFATAVGGTSLALKPDKSIAFQTGWGNNATVLAAMIPGNTAVAVPPNNLGFQGGAGGGSSGVYTKPSFQKGLPGSARLIPDIAYLADPFTGVEDIQTFGTQQFVSLVGGTSLSCPMFSALWAIAAQRGHEPLGQAAHLVYRLPENAVTDVVPFPSFFNVSGATITSTAFNFYFPDQLAAPLGNTKEYVSALYNFGSPQGLSGWFVLTFGTDSSLTTAVGWDNVTGVGTPNGEEFVEGVVQRE
jgi:subtilase family serine protease